MGQPRKQAALATRLASPTQPPHIYTQLPAQPDHTTHTYVHTDAYACTHNYSLGPALSSRKLLPAPPRRPIGAGSLPLPFQGARLGLETTGHTRWMVDGLSVSWGSRITSLRLYCPCSPNPLPVSSCEMLSLAPASRSYHGEAHIRLLECRTIIGAISCHSYHLPLLSVGAVDDACGRGQECAQGSGMLLGQGQSGQF